MLPILETERLLLRQFELKDTKDVFEFRSDPEVMFFVPRPVCKTEKEAEDFIQMMRALVAENKAYNWAIELKSQQKIIGMIGLINLQPEHKRAEIGYMLAKSYHQQGFIREALPTILNYGFEKMQLHSVEAVTDEENIASQKALLHFGFVKEAHFRENFFQHNGFRNTVHYGLLKSAFKKDFWAT